jgi:hypothetical protein
MLRQWYNRVVIQLTNNVPIEVAPDLPAPVDSTQFLLFLGAIARMDELVRAHRNRRDELAVHAPARSAECRPILEAMQIISETYDDLKTYAKGVRELLPPEAVANYQIPDYALGATAQERELLVELKDEERRAARATTSFNE